MKKLILSIVITLGLITNVLADGMLVEVSPNGISQCMLLNPGFDILLVKKTMEDKAGLKCEIVNKIEVDCEIIVFIVSDKSTDEKCKMLLERAEQVIKRKVESEQNK